jgi:hypothetical protein
MFTATFASARKQSTLLPRRFFHSDLCLPLSLSLSLSLCVCVCACVRVRETLGSIVTSATSWMADIPLRLHTARYLEIAVQLCIELVVANPAKSEEIFPLEDSVG